MHVRFFGGEGWPLAVWLVSEPVLSHCTRLGIGRGHTRRRGFHSPRDERGKVGRHCRRPAGGKETSGQRLAQAVHVRKWPCLLARGPFVDSTVTRPPPTRQPANKTCNPFLLTTRRPRRPTATPRGPASPTAKVRLPDRRQDHVPLLGRARPFHHFPLSRPSTRRQEALAVWGFRCFVNDSDPGSGPGLLTDLDALSLSLSFSQVAPRPPFPSRLFPVVVLLSTPRTEINMTPNL